MSDYDDNSNDDDDGGVAGEDSTHLDLPYLFFLLQSKRFKVIRLLRLGELSFQELKEKLKDNKYNYNLELHLDLLYSKGLVKKIYSDKRRSIVYGLTNFGNHIHDLSISLRHVCKHQDIFKDHSILDLPERFYLGIGVLNDVQIIRGRPKTVRKLIDMYKQSEFIYNILYEVEGTDDVISVLIDKLKGNSNFHARTIFGKNSILDPERNSALKTFEPFKRNGQISQKMMETVKIGLVVTDKSAFVVFPKFDENHPDMNTIIYGKNEEFRSWCLDYFNYCWDKKANDLDWKKMQSNQN